MKRIGILILFLAVGLLIALGISELTDLSIRVSGGISIVASLLIYLMLDLRPEVDPGQATIIRLTKSSWYKRRK